jgi:hypothetical protein
VIPRGGFLSKHKNVLTKKQAFDIQYSKFDTCLPAGRFDIPKGGLLAVIPKGGS